MNTLTPLQAIQPLIDDINRNTALKIAPLHNVEPPIARAEHLQTMIRQLRKDRDMYRKLLDDTERLLVDYQVLAGEIPF